MVSNDRMPYWQISKAKGDYIQGGVNYSTHVTRIRDMRMLGPGCPPKYYFYHCMDILDEGVYFFETCEPTFVKILWRCRKKRPWNQLNPNLFRNLRLMPHNYTPLCLK